MKIWLWTLTAIIILQAAALGILYSAVTFGHEELAVAINENAECIVEIQDYITQGD